MSVSQTITEDRSRITIEMEVITSETIKEMVTTVEVEIIVRLALKIITIKVRDLTKTTIRVIINHSKTTSSLVSLGLKDHHRL